MPINIPFLRKEIENLYKESLKEFESQLERYHVTRDNIHKDGTNRIGVQITMSNSVMEEVKGNFWDIYRKHQLLGKGENIGYNGENMVTVGESIDPKIFTGSSIVTKKKYLIKVNHQVSDEKMDKFAKTLETHDFIVYRDDLIEDIIELEVGDNQ